jgi:hypothetical protein
MTSPDDTRPEIAIDHIIDAIQANVAMAVRNTHRDITDTTIVDAPSEVQYAAIVRDVTKTMLRVGYMRTQVAPTHLRGAPDQCLVYRRIVEDLDDDNEILDDTCSILHTPEHLARKLCDDPRELGITCFDCDHPQYNVATPGPSAGMSSTIKAQRDFGVRRWLADTGCGRDLVSTSLVLKGGGEANIRARAPTYLNISDGIIEEMTMCIPQLDEMAERLCLMNAPSVLSVGERCVTMGYALFWPPFSGHPFCQT